MPRYAIYFTPPADSPWSNAGNRWLGRDPISGEEFPQRSVPSVPDSMLKKLTAETRRYGLHATLKAPFRLANGFSESHLIAMAEAFCALQRPIAIGDIQVRLMDNFLALRPTHGNEETGALAMRCVSYFDLLRAAPTEAELAKRHRAGLSERQEFLLQRWGYPYTEEEFRFHLSLTDWLSGVADDAVHALRKAAEAHFAAAQSDVPLLLDALTIFREEKADAPFVVWKHFPFDAQRGQAALPASGRLFFIVGPSACGKDALLGWVKQRLPPDADIVFARRVITRPVDPSEPHEAIDSARFWELAAGGHFAMHWQANDLCYGIRRGIEADLKAGRDVVVNGSREYLPQLRQLFPAAQVIWIEADAALIRARIEARHREAGAALRLRLERRAAFTPPDDQNVIRIDNSGSIEVAGQRLLDVLAGKRQA